jgi:tRNA-splicing ligase RtcB
VAAISLVEESPWRWWIDRTGTMRVPGIVFDSATSLPDVAGDRSLEEVVNVATLPGIVGASYAMPDVHWGYGFSERSRCPNVSRSAVVP